MVTTARNTMLKKKRQPQQPVRHANQQTVQEQVRSVPVVSTVLIAMLTAIAGAAGVALWTFLQNRWKRLSEKEQSEARAKAELDELRRQEQMERSRPAPPQPPGLKPYDGTYRPGQADAREPAPTPFVRTRSPEELADWEASLAAWQARLAERERKAAS